MTSRHLKAGDGLSKMASQTQKPGLGAGLQWLLSDRDRRQVNCYHCGIDTEEAREVQNPWLEHAICTLHCPFLRKQKGVNYALYFQDQWSSPGGVVHRAMIAQKWQKREPCTTARAMGYPASHVYRVTQSHPQGFRPDAGRSHDFHSTSESVRRKS